MRASPRAEPRAEPADEGDRASRPASGLLGIARAVAGPALIVGMVVGTLHDVVLGGRLFEADLLTFWLPQYCFLGDHLASGSVPGWNPFALAGVPFAADPQSGWMYAPAMALFTPLPCAAAMGTLVTLLPAVAGLGLYAFLRAEAASRVAATLGGLALAMVIAVTKLSVSLPFSGTLAWTAVTLAAAARLVRAEGWPARLGWAGATALAWGQIGGAHLSGGLVLGTLVLGAYVAAATLRRRAVGPRWVVPGLLLVTLPLVNLAVLVPRLTYAGETNLRDGYVAAQVAGAGLAGEPAAFALGPAAGVAWPLDLAVSPGPHLGAVVLGLAFAGWWSRRHRPTVAAFSLVGLAGYLLSLRPVAEALEPLARGSWLGALYLHGPEWFAYLVPLVLAVLGGLGAAAWQEGRPVDRVAMLVPGVGVWGLGPLVLGADPRRLVVLAAAGAATALVLALAHAGRRTALLAVLPVVLAVELAASHAMPGRTLPFRPAPGLLAVRRASSAPTGAYLRAGGLVEALRAVDGRYATVGVVRTTSESVVPGLIPDHGMLFGVENAGGFNPVQLRRLWSLVRADQSRRLAYHRTVFLEEPSPRVREALGIGALVQPARRDPPPASLAAGREGGWAVHALRAPAPLVSLGTTWIVVDGFEAALEAVTAGEPGGPTVLEEDPGIPVAARPGAGVVASVRRGEQWVRAEVQAPHAALAVFRVPHQRGWRATVDGAPARILAADAAVQAVPVPAGSHVVELRHDDGSVRAGLAGSAAALAALGGAALVLGRRARARRLEVP